MMKVLDFDIKTFENFLHQNLIEDLKSFDKILVLGIAEGGIPIAEIVFKTLNENVDSFVNQDLITVQRPSTKQKKKSKFTENLLKSIFSVLPKFVLNYLRVREHQHLSKRSKNDLIREVKLKSDIDFSQYDFVLIVDDAVDSGASMKTTIDFVKNKVKTTTKIKTISVVVTQKNPIYLPDYFQFRDVLIRFPWSLDGSK